MKIKLTSTIFGFILLVSMSILFIFLPKQTISSEDVNSVEVKNETIESGIQIESEIKEADSFTSIIEYPITKIEAIDSLIETWITEQEDRFYEQIEQPSYFFAKKQVSHLIISTKVEKVHKHLFSFKLNAQHYIKDSNQTEQSTTFVIDLKNKQLINITDVIKLDDKSKKTLKEAMIHADSAKRLTDDIINDKFDNIEQTDWILTKDQLIIYFYDQNGDNQNKIIHTSRLNNETIKNTLTDKYRKMLFPEKKQPKKKKTPKKKKKPKKKDKNKKLVALTFDDGPDRNITPQVLKTLDKHEVKATFFMLSNNVQRNPDIAKNIVKKGHEIANHSKTHINLNSVNKSRIEFEVIQSQKEIEAATGVKPTLFRPPYGEYNQTTINLATKTDQNIIMWSVDSYDWKSRNKSKIVSEIKRQTRKNSIILLHDIHQPTADSLDDIIKYLSKSGYEFVTVSELLSHIKPLANGVYYGK